MNSVNGICEIDGHQKKCVKIDDLERLFNPIVKLYATYDAHSAPAIFQGGGAEVYGPDIWERIEEDFGVFNSANDEG